MPTNLARLTVNLPHETDAALDRLVLLPPHRSKSAEVLAAIEVHLAQRRAALKRGEKMPKGRK